MSDVIISPAPAIEVRVNGQLLGMTQSVQTKVETTPVVVHSFGAREPAAVINGKRTYSVTLRRLLMDRTQLPNQTAASGLDEFSLSLSDGVMETTFHGCRVTRENTSYEAGKLVIEELEIQAKGRAWSVLS